MAPNCPADPNVRELAGPDPVLPAKVEAPKIDYGALFALAIAAGGCDPNGADPAADACPNAIPPDPADYDAIP